MKFLKPVFTVFFLFTFLFGLAQGQLKTFNTETPEKFYSDLSNFFLENTFDKKEANEFLDKFNDHLLPNKKQIEKNLPAFNENQRQIIYEICNQMLKKRMRPFPDFKAFLNSMMNFIDTKQSDKSFAGWQSCINKILSGKDIRSYSEFLQMSENLFASNTFFKSPTYSWSSDKNNYQFEYDSLPKVVFAELNLRCHNQKNDSDVIYNTSGTYYPSLGKFIGKGGRVKWLRAGIDENTVYADLKNYTVVTKTGGYTADSVVFFNKAYFNRPLLGVLNNKVMSEAAAQVTYPRFDSYTKRFQISELVEKVDFDGGFTQRGAKFIGSGSRTENAKIIIKRKGKIFVVAQSEEFIITKEKITSSFAVLKMFIDNDSIFHPGLSFKYLVPEKLLSLIRTEEGISKSPFYNTYHAMDMYFEELSWKVDEPKIDLKMLVGSNDREAEFTSSNFFKDAKYASLQGLDPVHPLIAIKEFVMKANAGGKEFTVDALAKYMHITSQQLRPSLITYASLGYIIFDAPNDYVYVKQRLFDHTASSAKKRDYDAINFHSVIPGQANATINLLNNEMTIRGCRGVLLSDSQSVFAIPADKQFVVRKNRDFTYSGVLRAGRFDFFGKDFDFEYDKFKVNLNNVDSARITARAFEANPDGTYKNVRLKSVLEHIKGEVLIDDPGNKSGLKSLSQYPILNSTKDSYVYYDKKSIQSGVYAKDKFYFHLEPYTLDSLDNFSNPGLQFKGEFASAGIFPTFKESISIQKDYSLGFVRTTPPEGFAAYGGKGKFDNIVSLSNEGLHGDGVLNYLTSTAKSGDFVFFPDSMNTTAITYDIKEQKGGKVEYPNVAGENIYIHWVPYKDLMQSFNKEKSFDCFNKQVDFRGRFDLTPKELSGKGLADFSNAQLEANRIIFKNMKFNSDTADFRLKALAEASLAFSTNNVSANVDLEARKGEFKSNGKGSIVKFPVNQYICYMEQFTWFMDKNDIELGGDTKKKPQQTDLDLTGPEFISVHPKQDSLRFMAPRARYDLKNYIISALEVPYINVADARIIPNRGNVTIKKNAVMETLDSAKIVANSITKYHTVHNATVNISARKSYFGSGFYDYIDENKTTQTIYFSSIGVDTTIQTFAETNIKEDVKFMLSPQYEFKGKVKLAATNQFLVFSGSTRIQHSCDAVKQSWLKFTAEINPNQIYIPIPEDIKDVSGDPLSTSIMTTNDSTHLYTAFLSKKRTKSDLEVLPSSGFLYFDKNAREYHIATKEKLVERNLPGNYLSLNVNNCTVYGEGKMNMASDLGMVEMQTVGNAQHFLVNDSTAFDVMFTLDFFFDDNILEKMADALNNASGLNPVKFDRPVYEKGLREIMGKEMADKLISQLNLYGSFKKFPDELKKSFFFNDVKLKWSSATRSYVSQGMIGVGNINKAQVNKFLNGKVELVKKRGGDVLTIYIEIDSNTWYFFTYTRGSMQVLSSDDANFNNVIKEMKSDKKQKKGDKGSYQFSLAQSSAKTRFLRKSE